MSEPSGGERRKFTANLPPGLTTRARNKEWRPGAPDLPKPRRTQAKVAALKAAELKARNDKLAAQQRVADIENRLHDEDSAMSEPKEASSKTSDKGERPDSNMEDSESEFNYRIIVSARKSPPELLTDLDEGPQKPLADERPDVEPESEDEGSDYQPVSESAKGESEPDIDSSSDLEEFVSKIQAVKKRKTSSTARAGVQAARAIQLDSSSVVKKRSLPVGHGKGSVEPR